MEEVVLLLKMVFSEELLLRLGTVCLVVDNLIIFYYFYHIQSYKTKEKARKEKALYRKLFAWKVGYFIFLLWMVLEDNAFVYGPMLFFAAVYYVYTAAIVVIFLVYAIKRCIRYVKV